MCNILYVLTRGGVPRSLGGVPEIVVDMPIAGDDVVTMAGDEDARPDGLGSGASLNPESVVVISIILLHENFLQFDWLRAVWYFSLI